MVRSNSLARDALSEDEGLLEAIVQSIDRLVTVIDRRGRVVVFNDACEELTGFPSDEVEGQPFWEVLLSREDSRKFGRQFRNADLQDVPATFEIEWVTESGQHRPIHWSTSTLTTTDGTVSHIIGTGNPLPDGQEDGSDPAEDGHFPERLADMISVCTHEVRNPLNIAGLYVELLERELDPEADAKLTEMVRVIDAQLDRAVDIMTDFSEYVRCLPLRRERGDVRQLIDESIERARTRHGEPAAAIDIRGPDTLSGEVDPIRLRRALTHLVENALEAAGQDGEVTIRLEADDASFAVVVEDDGPGLPDDPAQLFEPFQTTHRGYSGLGLAYVRRVARAHDGSITAESTGRGARFRLQIPLAED